jgi:hypothetical protein
MKQTISIVILLVNSLCAYSQKSDTLKTYGDFYGISAGFNYCKFRNDSIDFDFDAKPVIGFFGKRMLNKNINVKISVLYSVKGSTSNSPYIKLENRYIDLNLMSQLKITNDFYLQGGISYSNILSSKQIIQDGSKWNGVRKINYNNGFNSEINLVSGIEFKLHKRLSLEFNYFIPCSKNNNQNFQLTLNFFVNTHEQKTVSIRRTNRDLSKSQICQLKEGTLLVRLKTAENKISVLPDEDKIKKSDTIKYLQDAENKKIIAAFKKKFTFCNVAFFYSNYSEKIMERKFNKVFLNENLEIDNSIFIDTTKSIFTAEFGALTKDSIKYFSHYGYEPNKPWNTKQMNIIYTSYFGTDMLALFVMNDKFCQLQKPFPYFSKNNYFSINEQTEQIMFYPFEFLPYSTDRTVENLNIKLLKYYHKQK